MKKVTEKEWQQWRRGMQLPCVDLGINMEMICVATTGYLHRWVAGVARRDAGSGA